MLALFGLLSPIIGLIKAFFGMRTAQAQTAADVENNRVNAQAGVQEAEGHSPINAIVRALFAAPVAIYYAKLFLWDKVLGWGSTDALSSDLTHVSWVVIGFYFLTTIRS
jgi:hypothetical protein